jgi:uncharacterized protein with gpF-like domain
MTDAERITYWKEYARQTTRYERSGVIHFQKAIRNMVKPVIAHAVEKGAESALLSIDILVDRKIIEAAITDFYVYVAKNHKLWSEKDIAARAPKQKDRGVPPVDVDIASADAGFGAGFFNPAWLQRLKKLVYGLEAAKKVTNVTNTIKKKLRAVLGRAVKEEVRPSAIAKRIQSEMEGNFSEKRAKLIARTETTFIANQAARQSAIELRELTGLTMKKIWIATLDDKVRDSHWLNADPIGFDEKFKVGDSLMDLPGDPSAPIEELANCRCCVAYIPADDHEDIFPTNQLPPE